MIISGKRSIFISLMAAVLMAFFAVSAQATTIPLTISPSTVAGDSSGVTISTQADTTGGTVQIGLYYDENSNGVIDSNEWAFQKTVITDNMAGSPQNNPLGSSDTDPTNQNIGATVSFMGGIFPAGQYIVKVANALGASNIGTFTVTPVTTVTRTVTGTVYDGATSSPVAGTLVYCMDNATGAFFSAAMSASDGSYSLQIPTAGDIKIGYQKEGYVTMQKETLTVPDGGVTGHDLYLIESDAQITGTVTEDGTGNPIWGADIWAESSDGTYSTNDGFSVRASGAYSMAALSGMSWNVGADLPPGYFGLMANGSQQNAQITPTVSGPNVVNFTAHKITAWIDGTVTAEDGTPVDGEQIIAIKLNPSDQSLTNLQGQGTTDSSGNASVGIDAGDWLAGLCVDCGNEPRPLVNGKEMVLSTNGTNYTVAAGDHKSLSSTAYYEDGVLEGTVYQSDGTTPAANVGVTAVTANALNGPSQSSMGYFQTQTQTDSSGNFRLPLLGGTWTVQAQDWQSGMSSPTQDITLTTNGNEVIDLPSETVSGLSFTLGASQTGSGSISGTISYSGSQNNPIYVGVFTSPNIGPSSVPVYTTMINAPGTYTISNVADGTYYVGAMMTADPNSPQPTDPYGADLSPVTISGGNAVQGIDVTLFDGGSGSISGSITYTGNANNPIYIGVFDNPNIGPNSTPVRVATITAPGNYTVSGLADGTYYVGAVMTADINNIQMTDPYGMYSSPVTISGGNAAQGADITLVDGTAQNPNPFYTPPAGSGSISGTISYSGAQNNPVYIGVFDSPNIGPNSSPLYETMISTTGAYTITNIPDGTYYVGAVMTADINNIQQTDPYGMYPISTPGAGTPVPVTISGGNAQTGISFTIFDGTTQYPNPFAIAPTKIGVFDNGTWYLDSNMSWAWDGTAGGDTLGIFGVGLTGAIPVVGDWNGDGTTKIGVYMDGTWYLDMNRNWQWDGEPTDKMASFGAGLTGAIPVVGDWDGSGTTKIGIYQDGYWYLDTNGNGQWDGTAGGDTLGVFGVGLTNAVPVVGDWDGSGTTKIGIYEDGYWYLDTNGNGQWDGTAGGDTLGVFGVGLTNAVPVVGDWNADGTDEIGIYQQGIWYLDKNRSWQWEGEPSDQYGVFGVGLTGAIPVPGKW